MHLIGLEPTRPKPPDPKSGASTNFATSASCWLQRYVFCLKWPHALSVSRLRAGPCVTSPLGLASVALIIRAVSVAKNDVAIQVVFMLQGKVVAWHAVPWERLLHGIPA